jgi:GntR family transcriptional regulator
MLPFSVQLESGLPVSEQMVLAVRRAILSGQMSDGQEFPSVRVLAQELKISPTTAHKVVLSLKDEGLLAAKPGIGMVVRSAELPSRDARREQLRAACEALLTATRAQNLTLDDAVAALRAAARETSR